MMRKTILLTACTVLTTGALNAFAAGPVTALDGYCPVCLVNMDKLVKGDTRFSSRFDGRTYLFPNAKQERMFDTNPTAFVPALGGDCTVCKVEIGKEVKGKPQLAADYRGRRYLFSSRKQLDMFRANPTRYAIEQ